MKMSARKREFARMLRESQTTHEKKVWEILRDRRCFGLKFRRQHVIEGYVVDFYCHEYKLAIELDGGIHRRQKEYDRFRDEAIQSEDFYVLRINNWEIDKDIEIVKTKISRFIKGHCK